MNLGIVILAAGKGTRMRSTKAKVLHPLAGQPLLAHVLKTAHALAADNIVIVHGHQADQIRNAFPDEPVEWALQENQLGTGHAVSQALPQLHSCSHVVVLYADVPLLQLNTLIALTEKMDRGDLAVLTAETDNPVGYGRIVRNQEGEFVRIAEQKDCTSAEAEITEINSGILCVRKDRLEQWLQQLEPQNAQGEYYLTDIVEMAVKDGLRVETHASETLEEVSGVNDRQQLAHLERYYQRKRARELMQSGVTITDPSRVEFRGEITLECDVVIEPNVMLEGPLTIGADVYIGANTVIRNSTVANGVVIKENCVIEGAIIGNDSIIGPFARLRPETTLAANVHIGNFVEIKKSAIADRSKVNHLSYVGDSEVGSKVNIGAGTITCNYDGANKHKTIIGDNAFIGSDTQLVAPVTVGAGATIGAGSTITKHAPDNKLTLSRSKQTSIPGWERPVKKES